MSKLVTELRRRLPAPIRRIAGRVLALSNDAGHALARPYLERRRAHRRAALAQTQTAGEPVALFLTPEAAVRSFLAAHVVVARTAAGHGITPILLSCDGLLPTCTAKEVRRMPPTAPGADTKVCRVCRRTARAVGNAYELPDITIDSILSDKHRQEIAAIIARPFDSLLGLEYDGISFGTFVLGDTLRRRRLTDVAEFGDQDRALFSALTYSALAVYFAVRELTCRFNVRCIAFFGDYAYWLPIQVFAARRGIGLAGFDYGYNVDVDHRQIGIRPISANLQALRKTENWSLYSEKPLPPVMAEEILLGGLQRLGFHGGRTTFSPNWTRRAKPLQEELGLSLSRRTIVAYPSSSDEFVAQRHILKELGAAFATKPRPFADQAAWLEALIDWVGGRDDLQLVIRWHPRMGISANTTTCASEYAAFRKKFSAFPSNVVMVWPEEKTSSYNLAEICDAAAVSWSTMGLELARLGVPVVASFPDIGTYPVGSFIGFAPTPEGYFHALERALDQPASLAMITEAVRWSHYLFWSLLVDVSDLIADPHKQDVPKWKEPKNRDMIRRAIIGGEDMTAINMANLPAGPDAVCAERKTVMSVLESAAAFFLLGDMAGAPGLKDLGATASGHVSGRRGEELVTRYSPLAARIVTMLGSENAKL